MQDWDNSYNKCNSSTIKRYLTIQRVVKCLADYLYKVEVI